jgi:hypothetical protein
VATDKIAAAPSEQNNLEELPDWMITTSPLPNGHQNGKKTKKKIQSLRPEGKKILSQHCVKFACGR